MLCVRKKIWRCVHTKDSKAVLVMFCATKHNKTDSCGVLSSRSRWSGKLASLHYKHLHFYSSRVCLCLPCMRALLLLFRRFLWHVTAVLYVQYSITPNAPLLITCEHRFSYCIVHCAPKLASRLGFPYITSTRPVVQDFSSKRKRLQKSLKR